MTEPRICAYRDCREPFESEHPDARFCSGRCRTREWKAERAYGPQRPVRTGKRKPSGPQISYHKVIEYLASVHEARGFQRDDALKFAERDAIRLLPARQRARLLERGRS